MTRANPHRAQSFKQHTHWYGQKSSLKEDYTYDSEMCHLAWVMGQKLGRNKIERSDSRKTEKEIFG